MQRIHFSVELGITCPIFSQNVMCAKAKLQCKLEMAWVFFSATILCVQGLNFSVWLGMACPILSHHIMYAKVNFSVGL